MRPPLRRVLPAVALAAVLSLVPHAQMRVAPLDLDQGHAAIGLALRHLGNTGVFMQADAHPDDENNALLVMLNRGQGVRTALVTATRGNGGQNEIGPELSEALGVLRTEELAAVHRFDGAEQYFTRAVDFGYSFSGEETQKNWGPAETVGDFVRLIRTIRPDVMIAQAPDQFGDGAQHPTAGLLSTEAARESGDASKFPEQIAGGLRPWQPRKVYVTGQRESAARQCVVNLAGFDPLLGRTYAEVGTEARSMHKCQGMAQLLALPGASLSYYRLVQGAPPAAQPTRDEQSLFDGIDTSLTGLAQFAGPRPPRELTSGLSAVVSAVQEAQKKFDGETDGAMVPPLAAGLRAVRALRATVREMPEPGRYEIDFRLRQKEREFQQAIILANGLRVEALADDGVVVPGQPLKVSLIVANRGASDVTIKQVKFDGFDGDAGCSLPPVLRKGDVARCEPALKIKQKEPVTEPYWHREDAAGLYTFDKDAPFGLPYRPTSFYAQVTFAFANGEEVFDGLPVQYRYQGDIFSGEKRTELLVVPPLSVRVSPEVAIVPAPAPAPPTPAVSVKAPVKRARPGPVATSGPVAGPPSREIRVSVVNDSKGAADALVRLAVPPGWTSMPPEQMLAFSREDESQTVRFEVAPAPNAPAGEYHVRATASVGGAAIDRGYQVVEYPHIRRQHVYHDADVTVKVLDVKTAPNLTVGYIEGAGDDVPAAIEQLGAKVEAIGPDDLAWGDLSRFGAIVTGVRAYERRADLRANNGRLIDYVRSGGTLVVQYNKLEFNQAQFGPYPAQVGRGRVTDESSPVTVLAPADPLFNAPNKITDASWAGWVQERGLYFLGEHDSRYHDLVALADPFPLNAGEKRGALVEATYGKGHWVYVGLALWRQLPAGVPGAYQLLANLISLR